MINAQKTPLSRTLAAHSRDVAVSKINNRWIILPGSVIAVDYPTVTVAFNVQGLNVQNASMPIAMSEYVQIPVSVGDLGMAISASAYIGMVSGFGTGNPAASELQPNLANLVWIPLSNAKWEPIDGGGGAVAISENVVTTDNVVTGNGASGTFTTASGQTVDVLDGVVVNIY